jgi:hypothetical protein
MSGENLLVTMVLFFGTIGVVIQLLEMKCPKCGRWGARRKGDKELAKSVPEAPYFEWQRQDIGSVQRESQTLDSTFGTTVNRSVESVHADVKYEVKKSIEYYEVPCRCRDVKCSHIWRLTLPPVTRVLRQRVS